jgi:hypothetical protein
MNEGIDMIEILDKEWQEKLINEVSQGIIERIDSHINYSLDLLRSYLEKCYQQEPNSTAIASNIAAILKLIDETHTFQEEKNIIEICNKIEEIINKVNYWPHLSEEEFKNVFDEVQNALDFCKHEIAKIDNIVNLHKNILRPRKPDESNIDLFEKSVEYFEELAELLDQNPELFRQGFIQIINCISASGQRAISEEIKDSQEQDKLRQRLRNAIYFILNRIPEIYPFAIKPGKIENPAWDNPPPASEAMKKTLAMMRRDNLWTDSSLAD